MKKLIIDLGHGGYDSGAVGQNKTKESLVVLSIGKYLEDMLKDVDLDVKFTRISDKYLSLGERVKMANDFKGDYFLSIHINAAKDKSVRGVEVWQYSEDKKLNKFSSDLCSDICRILNIKNRGIKYSKNLYVLRNTSMKSALLEVDFISNEFCEKALNKEDNIKAIARAIKDNILKLYNIENNEKLYKVCIGSYINKSNAISMLELAKSKGFNDAYLIN